MSARVLVVDDSRDLRELICLIVAGDTTRWTVVGEAGNGEEAIAQAGRLQPDLVVLDLSMPVMDGLAALPRLRQVVPDAAVVVLTGFPAVDVIENLKAAGAQGYLQKRDLAAQLLPTLATVLAEFRAEPLGCFVESP